MSARVVTQVARPVAQLATSSGVRASAGAASSTAVRRGDRPNCGCSVTALVPKSTCPQPCGHRRRLPVPPAFNLHGYAGGSLARHPALDQLDKNRRRPFRTRARPTYAAGETILRGCKNFFAVAAKTGSCAWATPHRSTLARTWYRVRILPLKRAASPPPLWPSLLQWASASRRCGRVRVNPGVV